MQHNLQKMPTFASQQDLLEERVKVTQALSKVLETPLSNSRKVNLGLIGLYYCELEKAIESQNFKMAKCSLEKLKRLLGELIIAKRFFEYQKDGFSKIVRDLTSPEPSNSFGARAELMMLNFLLEDFLHTPQISLDDIVKRESPDYSVKTSHGNIFLEVTHVRLHKAKKKGIGDKIRKAIRAKSNKPYSNRQTVLFLDITNLVYRQIEAKRSVDELKPYAEKTLSNSSFGAVVLMCGLFTEQGKYIPDYFTVTHREASEALTGFLNRHYPNNHIESKQMLYPTPTM